MIVDPLSLNNPRHGQQNYRDLSEPHQGRRILAGIFGGAPLQWHAPSNDMIPTRLTPGRCGR
jgi:hypothetical protein